MSKVVTTLASFNVLDADGATALPTIVAHHCDIETRFELITLTQTNPDGDIDVVAISREQLAALANQAKGH